VQPERGAAVRSDRDAASVQHRRRSPRRAPLPSADRTADHDRSSVARGRTRGRSSCHSLSVSP
jgi:hypothetical protein